MPRPFQRQSVTMNGASIRNKVRDAQLVVEDVDQSEMVLGRGYDGALRPVSSKGLHLPPIPGPRRQSHQHQYNSFGKNSAANKDEFMRPKYKLRDDDEDSETGSRTSTLPRRHFTQSQTPTRTFSSSSRPNSSTIVKSAYGSRRSSLQPKLIWHQARVLEPPVQFQAVLTEAVPPASSTRMTLAERHQRMKNLTKTPKGSTSTQAQDVRQRMAAIRKVSKDAQPQPQRQSKASQPQSTQTEKVEKPPPKPLEIPEPDEETPHFLPQMLVDRSEGIPIKKNVGRPLTDDEAILLKNLLFGSPSRNFGDEWRRQGFTLCDSPFVAYGLSQRKPGPCSVMCALQCDIIREILFEPGADGRRQPNPRCFPTIWAHSLTRILVRCGNASFTNRTGNQQKSPSFHFCLADSNFTPTGGAAYKRDGITEKVQVYTFSSSDELKQFLLLNITWLLLPTCPALVLLTYSLLLTFGLSTVENVLRSFRLPQIVSPKSSRGIRQSLVDYNTIRLISATGQASVPLLMLFLTGHPSSHLSNATATTWTNVNKSTAVQQRADYGLLTLTPHCANCDAESFLKTPRFPIWLLVFPETPNPDAFATDTTHYAVVFGLQRNMNSDWKMETYFDLFYYSPVAHQKTEIRLTLDNRVYAEDAPCPGDNNNEKEFIKRLQKKSAPLCEDDSADDEDVVEEEVGNKTEEEVSPVQLTLLKKWPDAKFDWNGHEPVFFGTSKKQIINNRLIHSQL